MNYFNVRNLRNFGNYLETYRLNSGLFQYQMAEKIGMDKGNYNKLIKGKLNISLNRMILILSKINAHIELFDDCPY